ncbi:EVE domain-containing protein [Lysobacteraceae bacterium NML95-0200]|nr:EVE domain-containing protein [Xanthomonadaceae bacterium NML95-0200]
MRYWLGVVSREHVLRGVAGGFCQLCHGKAAPLQRMQPGDWLLYYSPTRRLGEAQKYQAFTAVGRITGAHAYRFPMAEDFIPWRRDVDYLAIRRECPITVARQHPEWPSYTRQLRYGHFEISAGFAQFVQAQMLDHADTSQTPLWPEQ